MVPELFSIASPPLPWYHLAEPSQNTSALTVSRKTMLTLDPCCVDDVGNMVHIFPGPSDPAVVHVDDDVMAVKDKYPKAKHHYLVMPRSHSFSHYRYVMFVAKSDIRNMQTCRLHFISASNYNNTNMLEHSYLMVTP